MLPDRVEDSEEQVVKQIQQYCTELDRSKFTSQHKQALRNLLGSSSSGSDASASGTCSPQGRLTVTGPALPLSRRTRSADSRSSGSDCDGGVGGGGARARAGGAAALGPERRVGTKRARGRRAPAREGECPNRQAECRDCREGASPQRLRPDPAQCVLVDRGGPGAGPRPEGREHVVPDSGYEGTESDSTSFRKGGATFDLDSQLSSSDLDAELMSRAGDSPPSSSSSSSSDPTLPLPPPPSSPPTCLNSLRSSPLRAAVSPTSRRHDHALAGASKEKGSGDVIVVDVVSNCDVTSLPEAAVVRQQTVHGETEEAAATEHEALLTAETDDDKVCEHDTFL